MSSDSNKPQPSLWVAFIPLIVLFALLGFNVSIYGDDSLSGANQTALILVSALTVLLSLRLQVPWTEIQEGILNNIHSATPAILILFLVGAIVGTWLISGIVPSMIYYGLGLFSPKYFAASCCLLAAIASLVIGSSWSTSATLGVALMGIGHVLGMNPALVAGSILSGAYFGDKLSPLSDTTNLASGVANVDLFKHIRYLSYTTVPSFSIALLVFFISGLFTTNTIELVTTQTIQKQLLSQFYISPILLCAPIIVLVLIAKKVPAIPALFIGVVLGILFATIYQNDLLQKLSNDMGLINYGNYKVIMNSIYGDIAISTGNETLNELLKSSGMKGMLNTIWLIIAAMVFGGVMDASGFLKIITNKIIQRVRSLGGMVSATVGTCILTNLSASDQYLSVVVPGKMFVQPYQSRGIPLQNLSRSLEDGGTVTGVLVPWNTCGAFHAGVLGVSTYAYAPWVIFCWLSPIMSIIFAYLLIRIAKD